MSVIYDRFLFDQAAAGGWRRIRGLHYLGQLESISLSLSFLLVLTLVVPSDSFLALKLSFSSLASSGKGSWVVLLAVTVFLAIDPEDDLTLGSILEPSSSFPS